MGKEEEQAKKKTPYATNQEFTNPNVGLVHF